MTGIRTTLVCVYIVYVYWCVCLFALSSIAIATNFTIAQATVGSMAISLIRRIVRVGRIALALAAHSTARHGVAAALVAGHVVAILVVFLVRPERMMHAWVLVVAAPTARYWAALHCILLDQPLDQTLRSLQKALRETTDLGGTKGLLEAGQWLDVLRE